MLLQELTFPNLDSQMRLLVFISQIFLLQPYDGDAGYSIPNGGFYVEYLDVLRLNVHEIGASLFIVS